MTGRVRTFEDGEVLCELGSLYGRVYISRCMYVGTVATDVCTFKCTDVRTCR